MSNDVLQTELPPPPQAPVRHQESLTHQVSKGVVWLTIQAIGVKGATTLTNLALAYFLDKSDFGLLAKVYTVMAFVGLVQQTGQREILIQRQRHFSRWVNPAFWMSLGTGILGAALVAISAPIVAVVLHDPRIVPLLLILSLGTPLDSMALVPTAKLQISMRFKALSILGIVVAILTTAGTVGMAAAGFGAISFVLFKPIASLVNLIATWQLSAPALRWNPQFRRWRYMLRDAGHIFGIGVMSTILSWGDNLLIALLCPDVALANYYFAYGLSVQAAQLVISNLQSALFPALSRMGNDAVRQTAAYIRATQVSGLLGSYMCGLVGLLAGPGLRFFFGDKWVDAIPILQVLSIVMSLTCIFGPTGALFQAQGRFGFLFGYCALSSALFLIAAALGAVMGQALGVAVALLVLGICMNPTACYLAIRRGGGSWMDIVRLARLPLLLSAVVFGSVYLSMERIIQISRGRDALFMATIPPLTLCAYAMLLRVLSPKTYRECREHLQGILAKLIPGSRQKRLTPYLSS